jgi:beta-galactosidase
MDKDYRDFYMSTIADFSVILAGWMRELGIDCDLIHNSGNPSMNPYFLETISALGDGFLLGSDLYYNLNMDWEANNPTPKAIVKSLICHDELKLMGYPSTIYEMQAGSASEWPPILPEDLKCWYMANIAFGMKAVNYYVFTGGPNPENIGGDGRVYDYGAGIAADGTIRPVYYAQKEFGAFLTDNPWLSRTERVSDYYIGLDWEQARSKSESWEFMQKGVIISSLCASLMPELIDLGDKPVLGDLSQYKDKPLVVVSSACMSLKIQQNLIEYVKSGGTMFIVPEIPCMDENFEPCTVLADFIGAGTVGFSTSDYDVNVCDLPGITNNKLWKCDVVPESAEVFATDEISKTVLGWKLGYPDGGTVMWLGVKWRHEKLILGKMMRRIFDLLNVTSAAVECDNPNVWTALRVNKEGRMLFLMNLFSSPLEAGVKVKSTNGSYTDTGKHKLTAMEVKAIKV